jgi:hypothetical protein
MKGQEDKGKGQGTCPLVPGGRYDQKACFIYELMVKLVLQKKGIRCRVPNNACPDREFMNIPGF